MTNDIITIIPSALAITAPLVIGSMLLSNYNGITSLRRGIDISLSEISHAIIQRNNEFPRLIEKMQGQLKEVDKYFLETNTARRTSKRAVELRDVVKISSAEEKMKQSISDMKDIIWRYFYGFGREGRRRCTFMMMNPGFPCFPMSNIQLPMIQGSLIDIDGLPPGHYSPYFGRESCRSDHQAAARSRRRYWPRY